MRSRRCFLVVLSLAILSGLSVPAPAGDWPQFLGPTRDGVAAGPVAATFPDGGPLVLWQREVGQGFSGPVVSGGKLVQFHRVKDEEVVDCFEAETGKPLWREANTTTYVDDFGFDEGPRATPAIADGKVFTFGAEGRLACRALETGEEVWSVDTKREFKADKGFFGMACSPLVVDDLVILNIGGRGCGVVAFEAATGKVRWKATDDGASYSSPVAATIGGMRRVLLLTRAGFVSIDPATGKVAATFPWRSRSNSSVNAAVPLVSGDRVFLSASYGTGAVLLDYAEPNPTVAWQSDDVLSNHYATSVRFKDYLFGFHGRQEQGPVLRCAELATGKVRWSAEPFGAGTVLVAGEQLVVLSETGKLMIAPASPDGFKPTAAAQILSSECRAHPALAGGLFFARSKDKLVCVDLRTPAAH